MKQTILSDQQLTEEIEPVLKALRPAPILRDFFLHWLVLGAFIGFGAVWASEVPWSNFHPSVGWILTVVLGSGISAAGPAMIRIWGVRRFLTRTNEELRQQVEKDWLMLSRPGWVRRVAGFSLAASVVFGTSMGLLFSILFPGDRVLGSTFATMAAMSGMFLAPILPLAFGGRALLVRKITQRVERTLTPTETPSPREI